jgi:hypothetical protein
LIPQGVLAGLFFIMGVQALQANGITQKLVFLAQDRHFSPASNPLKRLERRSAIWAFVILELVGFGATFAITQTIAAIGFPVIILLLIPVRSFLLPLWFRSEELAALDAPTASPFTMESVGGVFGFSGDEDDDNNFRGGSAADNGNGGLFTTSGETAASHRSSSEESVVDDELERGESYRLSSRPTARKRSTTTKS